VCISQRVAKDEPDVEDDHKPAKKARTDKVISVGGAFGFLADETGTADHSFATM
jgi:hypothetical protein